MNKSSAACAAVAAATCLASTAALADAPLGFYFGAAVGESTVRSDNNDYGSAFGDDYHDAEHHFGWKAVAGIRPIAIVGAELEYIDFGHPGGDGGYYGGYTTYGPDSHPRALAAFGVGHIPLPLPFLDIYGKAGAARLHTDVNGFDGPTCYAYPSCPAYASVAVSQNRWDTRFAYGVGVQTRFTALSVRAEYERIDSPYGDPDLFSVGVTWTF